MSNDVNVPIKARGCLMRVSWYLLCLCTLVDMLLLIIGVWTLYFYVQLSLLVEYNALRLWRMVALMPLFIMVAMLLLRTLWRMGVSVLYQSRPMRESREIDVNGHSNTS